jgi:predicted Fe-Mo cluster-binding NifX family protein
MHHDGQTEKSELHLNGLSPVERVSALKRAGITTLICGGISKGLQNMLEGARIRVVTGIAGPVEEVLLAFVSDRLDDPQFYMPGRRGKYGRPRDGHL